MNRMRLRIADRLKDAQNTNAMLTTFNEIDMSSYINMRKDFGEAFLKRHEIKLGFMSGFVKASTLALMEQPVVNAVIDGKDMVYRDFVDISVAVSTPKGLVVPVLRNCQDMEMHHVEKQMAHLGQKAKKNEITLEDMTGGSFTITNGGVFGSMMGTPIINPPQSAILGMHATKMRPVVVGSQILARPIMYVALTYDHRIIDGREAVLFLRQIKETIEDPRRILLGLGVN
jgi:2-oxoglutarate dehydrogenase E2 component (dihydrolipoamide succinyltransferase)